MLACALVAVVVALAAEGVPVRKERAEADQGTIVWAALGASDAAGEGTPQPARDNWVARIAARLPADVVVHNLGVSGSTLAEARREQLPAALTMSPDVVSFWLVVNDLLAGIPLDDYERDLAATLRALREAGCQVVVGNAPDLAHVPALASDAAALDQLRRVLAHWNAAIARVAAAYGAEVVDLYAHADEFAARPDYLGWDGFHPSMAGHERLADLFEPAIRRAIAAAVRQPVDEDGSGVQ